METATTPAALAPSDERQDDLIYDVGMNICEDTDFYLKKGFRVVAIEANPAACEAAAERYRSQLASGRLTILNRAVSATRDPLLFYVCRNESAWSTASPRLRDQWLKQGAEFDEIEIESATMPDILLGHGVPYYAKIDIEGFDLVCLEGFTSRQARPKFVSFEVDFYTLDAMLDCAGALGYRRFALIGQSSVPEQRPPDLPREGLHAEHAFRRGASGLFGAELPAPWLTIEAMRARCAAVIRQYRTAGVLDRLQRVGPLAPAIRKVRQRRLPLAGDWYDIHAAF